MKIIKIESCNKCPNKFPTLRHGYRCIITSNLEPLPEDETIHKGCQLENYLQPIEITDKDIETWDACPCKILDEPCKHNCSCVEKFSSAGCNYCSTYGSKEQRKQMAEYLKRKIDFYMPTDKDIEAYYPVTSSHQMDTNSWNNRLRQEGAKAVLNNEIKHIEK